jgi:hypothetical protein
MIDDALRAGIRRAFDEHIAMHGPEAALNTLKLARQRVGEELASELDRVYRDAEQQLTRSRSSGLTVDDVRSVFARVQRGGSKQ